MSSYWSRYRKIRAEVAALGQSESSESHEVIEVEANDGSINNISNIDNHDESCNPKQTKFRHFPKNAV